ncbi:MAG: hypothetical protein V1663_02510 [archaeon]|uniref:Uncharacterized protein n=1 Tax=viral metagenome TaxID=1070528 RepID=A0A6M3IEN3_9ZZZZ
MILIKSNSLKEREITFTLNISYDEAAKAGPIGKFELELLKEYGKSTKISNTLSGLVLIIKNIEESKEPLSNKHVFKTDNYDGKMFEEFI